MKIGRIAQLNSTTEKNHMDSRHSRSTIPWPTVPYDFVETETALDQEINALVLSIARARTKRGRMVQSLSFDQKSDGRYGWTVKYYDPSFQDDTP